MYWVLCSIFYSLVVCLWSEPALVSLAPVSFLFPRVYVPFVYGVDLGPKATMLEPFKAQVDTT